MGEILDKSRMYIHNDDGDYTLETDIIQDIRDHIAYCKELRNRPGNGFWDQRKGRMVGSIPSVAYLKGLQEGYDMECADREIAHKEKLRYLNDHPEWRTVPHIDTPGHTGQIIIK